MVFMDVDKYIAKQKSPQKEICRKLRKLILKVTKKEEFRMGVPWYGKYYIVALKDHVNLGVCIKGLPKNQLAMLEGKGKTMGHVKFFSVKGIDEEKIVRLLKSVK